MARDIRNVALSWQQVVGIVLLMGALILGFAACVRLEDEDPKWVASYRLNMGIACAVCATISAFFFVWHVRNTRRSDIYPDVLERLMGADRVCEINTLHFWAAGRQLGDGGSQARVVVVLQNVYEGPCEGRLQLNAKGTTIKIPRASEPLMFRMAGAEVLACWRDLPVPVTGALSFGFDLTIRKPKSRRVRFRRRTAIRTDSASTALLVTGLMAGHIAYHGGSRLEFPLVAPPADALATASPTEWMTMSLWSLEEQRSPEAVGELLRKLLEP
jgi:hypothetical protein